MGRQPTVALKVAALADGTRTMREIAEELGVGREYVSATLGRQGLRDKVKRVNSPPGTGLKLTAHRRLLLLRRAHDAWDGGEFVTLTIAGVDYVMTDIGMRMLTPRELFNAQGFPPDYVIEGVWEERDGGWHWKPFPKDVQVSCCGNSVCPDLARAIIAANCQHLIQEAVAA